MLLTNHVLVGATIGAVSKNPAAAYAAGVASHFAMDAIPHWGGARDRSHWWRVAITDGLTALAALAVVAAAADQDSRARVVAGALGAATPDADKPYRELFHAEIWPDAVNTLHRSIQQESPRRMPQEFAVAAGSALVVGALLARRRRRA